MISASSVVLQVFQLLSWVVILYVILGWVIRDPYHPLRRALDSIVEPVLAPIRRVLPQTGMFDFSPMVLLIALQLLGSVLAKALR